MERILIIEDDPDIALSLQYALEREVGFEVQLAHDGEIGLEHARRDSPDLVLLDLNLPRVDGMEICRQLRRNRPTATVPIIMLTARVEEADKLAGLSQGADDYITKPFSIKEVVARVHAVLRRSRTTLDAPDSHSFGALELDESRRRVTVEGREVHLTRKEFDLLSELLRSRGRVLSRDQLLERVWGYHHAGTTRTVDVHVRQLRKKLAAPAASYIETVVGVGYRIREQD